MTIKTQQLNSTAISAVEYNTETQDMSITFVNGGTYDFHGVPEDVYDGLTAASSPGRFYHQNIKDRYS